MICPYCDSLLKESPESGTCPNCGGALISKREMVRRKKLFPDPPIGLYKDYVDYIEITSSDVRMYVKIYCSKCDVRKIPFEEIGAVSIRPGSMFTAGSITVRTREHANMPAPNSYMEAVRDNDTMLFDVRNYKQYFKIFSFLKECAEINTAE